MARSTALAEILRLDPVRDHQRIVFLTTRLDFSFDTTRGLELALFRTFCVPSISGLLHRTGEFERRPQKRYDDTDILVSELIDWGYESERGRAAIQKINQIHGRFRISNEDFLYVLSTFIFEPIRFNERFGWRKLVDVEKLAMFYFWREVGRQMGIRDLPEHLAAFEVYNLAYEREHFRFTEANQKVGLSTLEMFAGWFPRPFRPLVRQVIYTMMDDRTRKAFGFPGPRPLLKRLILAGMAVRARLLPLIPPRRRPLLRTQLKQRTYPHGYTIDQLGP
jgi:hypothetical protein